MRKRIHNLVVLAAVLFCILFGGGHVFGADCPGKTAVFEGAITFVEPDGTLTVRASDGTNMLVYARSITTIYSGEKTAGVTDLKPGEKVFIRYIPSSRTAIEIRVFP
jgi:hypothetical protein